MIIYFIILGCTVLDARACTVDKRIHSSLKRAENGGLVFSRAVHISLERLFRLSVAPDEYARDGTAQQGIRAWCIQGIRVYSFTFTGTDPSEGSRSCFGSTEGIDVSRHSREHNIEFDWRFIYVGT